MATFIIQLDRRKKLKNEEYNLVVRVNVGSNMIYLNVGRLTEKQYDHVFEKNSMDDDSIDIREKCEGYKIKCQRILKQLGRFDKARFRELFYEEEKIMPKTLLLKDLFTDYYTTNENIRHTTKGRYRSSMNIFETFMKGASVYDVTADYLKKFERYKLSIGNSPATIASNITDLKRVLNYYTKVKKVIPKDYEYPFSESGYRIKNFIPNKTVLENVDIESVAKMKKFDTSEQEYARDIWLMLYRFNGSNFVDLLRMRWSNIKGKDIRFYRWKTESTKRKNLKQIIVPKTKGITQLLDKIGDKNSPFILGKLEEGYSDETLYNKSNKMRGELNEQLKVISTKLKLTSPLRISKARECYATTLRRANKPIDQISEAMGHSSLSVTMNHYIGNMNSAERFGLNDALF